MIETKRLKIHSLTHHQLLKYRGNDHSLEKELNLSESSRVISTELKEALENTILPNFVDTTKNYLYSTLWAIIDKTNNRMIGELCIIAKPNEIGEIEIGYGTHEHFRNNGFMTEAVEGLIKWAEKQPRIYYINACTERKNIASFSVLLKNKFKKVNLVDNLIHWQLKLEKHSLQ